MKQTLQIIQKELSNNATKLNASENYKKTLEQKLAKAEAELKKYETHKVSGYYFVVGHFTHLALLLLFLKFIQSLPNFVTMFMAKKCFGQV